MDKLRNVSWLRNHEIRTETYLTPSFSGTLVTRGTLYWPKKKPRVRSRFLFFFFLPAEWLIAPPKAVKVPSNRRSTARVFSFLLLTLHPITNRVIFQQAECSTLFSRLASQCILVSPLLALRPARNQAFSLNLSRKQSRSGYFLLEYLYASVITNLLQES